MDDIAPIIKEILVDYMTKVVMENGLGSMEEYNISVESINKNEMKMSMFIDELSEGINLPIYDYAVKMSIDKFEYDMNNYINEQTMKFLDKKTKTSINLSMFILTVIIKDISGIVPIDQLNITKPDISVLQP